jgi:hypothetical protein
MVNFATLPVEVENSVSHVPVFAMFRSVVILLIMKYEPDLININFCDSDPSKSANLGLSEVDDTAIPLEWNK